MDTKPTLLIVDDEKPTREGLRAALEERFDVYVAEDAASAIQLLEQERFDVVLTDFRLPKEDGMKVIARAKSLSRPPVCILMTAYGSEELAVEAMKRGADDYIAKGRLQIDELELRIARALKSQRLEGEVRELRQQLDEKFGLENIVGRSPAMLEVFETIKQVAPTPATVLIRAKAARARNWLLGQSTRPAAASTPPGSASIALCCPPSSWKANCSDMSRAPSPAQTGRAPDASNWPMAAPSSSMK